MVYEHQNDNCLNNGYIDCYGNIHEEHQPYPNEDSRCYNYDGSHQKVPKYDKIQVSFHRKKLRYQQAKSDLETEREMQPMQYHHSDSNLHVKSSYEPFKHIPSYSKKRIQCKLFNMETKLQKQYENHIKAEKEREKLLQKLTTIQQQDGFHQFKKSIAKKVSNNITENAWKEKELVRNNRNLASYDNHRNTHKWNEHLWHKEKIHTLQILGLL